MVKKDTISLKGVTTKKNDERIFLNYRKNSFSFRVIAVLVYWSQAIFYGVRLNYDITSCIEKMLQILILVTLEKAMEIVLSKP